MTCHRGSKIQLQIHSDLWTVGKQSILKHQKRSDTIIPVMEKEQYSSGEHKSDVKEFLKKWGTRIGLVALGFMALSWLL
jgi:hypothetical protein